MNAYFQTAGAPDARALGVRESILRAAGYLLVLTLPFALAWSSLAPVFRLVVDNDTFSQIPLIPLVTVYLIYERRKAIFSELSFAGILGAALILPGLVLLVVARLDLLHLSATNPQSLLIFAIVLVWIGGFALCFGPRAFWAACFPLFFLLFMVPLPEPLLSKAIYALQAGSSSTAAIFFRIAGVPYLRDGFVFQLPGFAIRVAEECSGIRSTLALLITTVLAANMFLKTTWRRAALCAAVVPLAVFKNGLRIATLCVLSMYVNPGFLYGRLHHEGGFVFFLVALVPLALLLFWFQRQENRSRRTVSGARS
jgi:exosortase